MHDMIDLLFDPMGRIGKRRFWQGMVVLTVASLLVVFITAKLYRPISLLDYALIFPYICVYGKRLHDTGKTAWWVVPIGLAVTLLQSIIFAFIFAGLFPELYDQFTAVYKSGGSLQAIILLADEGGNLNIWGKTASIIISHTIIALVVGHLKPDAPGNKYG